jgi:hypothetical protein
MAAPYATPFYSSQGVQLFGLNQLTSPAAVMTMASAMGLQNIGGQASDIKISNLDSPGFEEFVKGLVDGGSPSGDVVYNFKNATHQWLSTMLVQGQNATTQWFVGAADAATTIVPTISGTIASGNVTLEPPKTSSSPKTWKRSGFYFYAYVKQFSVDIQTNSFIKAKLTLRVTGAVTPIVLGAAATF